jgi:hypothetical protein
MRLHTSYHLFVAIRTALRLVGQGRAWHGVILGLVVLLLPLAHGGAAQAMCMCWVLLCCCFLAVRLADALLLASTYSRRTLL